MKNFLLIYPTKITEAPMTLAMLGAVLVREGFTVHTCINTFRNPLRVQDFVRKAMEVKADYVGITMLTFEVLFVYELVNALKSAGFKVIVGGPHPTDCPQECIDAGADYVVCGEGEGALVDIVRGKVPKGIIPKRPRLDVSKLPCPILGIFEEDDFLDEEGFMKGFHRIYTSRGCPGTCTFCDWKVFGQKFSEYDVRRIVNEILYRRNQYGIKSFSIADDCFTVNRERVLEFCSLIRPLNVQWRANSRANLVDREILERMRESGCHSIAFGLESGDPETLRRIGKGVKLEDNIQAPKLAYRAGLEVYGCLMTGFPWETPESIKNQLKFIEEVWYDVTLFQVSGSLMPFPGAAIYMQYAKKMGFEKYWLRPEYQDFGIQVYQNAPNPFKVSTFYQRHLFDDTYIRNEYFFHYTKEYKEAVKELVKKIGEHNVTNTFPSWWKREAILATAELSMFVYDHFPRLEKLVVGSLFHGRSKAEKARDKRRGIAKSYTHPN